MPRAACALLLLAACDGGKPDTFKRDQPEILRLFAWDGHTVAESDRYYRLDVDEEKAVPIEVLGLDGINNLVMKGTTPLAFGFIGTRRALKERRGVAWEDIPLPEEWSSIQIPARLAADESSLVVWGGRRIPAPLGRPGLAAGQGSEPRLA